MLAPWNVFLKPLEIHDLEDTKGIEEKEDYEPHPLAVSPCVPQRDRFPDKGPYKEEDEENREENPEPHAMKNGTDDRISVDLPHIGGRYHERGLLIG
jgi:hypothetical protein